MAFVRNSCCDFDSKQLEKLVRQFLAKVNSRFEHHDVRNMPKLKKRKMVGETGFEPPEKIGSPILTKNI